MIGKHRVEIAVRDDANPPPEENSKPKSALKNKVPEQYNRQSVLIFDVPAEGTNKADFALESQ